MRVRLWVAGVCVALAWTSAASGAAGDQPDGVPVQVVAPKATVVRVLVPSERGGLRESARCTEPCEAVLPRTGAELRVETASGELVASFPVRASAPSVLSVDLGSLWMQGVGAGLAVGGGLAFLYGSGAVADAAMAGMGESHGPTDQGARWVAFGAGLVGLVSGIAMYVSGTPDVTIKPTRAPTAAALPANGGGVLTWRCDF